MTRGAWLPELFSGLSRASSLLQPGQVYRICPLQALGLRQIREVVVSRSYSRRQILGGLAGLAVVGVGAGGAYRYWLGKVAEAEAGHDYELIAAPLDVELVPGHKTEAWAFGPSAPGTELRVRQGEWLRVRFINHLPVATTIHWHGIRLPLEMDGVPYVSQLPVLPGEYFDYKFRVPDAGSYWYHPHVNSSEELGRGLVGPLIIEEREPTGFKHERTLSLKSWHVDEEGAFVAFSIPREAARGGTAGRLSTINGVSQAVIDLPAGQITRVRLLNLDNTLTYRINIPDVEAQIYALDGNPIEPRPLGKEYWLGPGMRICLAIKAPPAGEELSIRNGPVRLGTFRSVANTDAPTEWPPTLPANPIAEPDLANAEKLNFNFEWVGSVSVNTDNGKPPSLWQINGKAWDITDKTCADRPIAKLEKGKSYIFELKNMTQYQHPIHLHGVMRQIRPAAIIDRSRDQDFMREALALAAQGAALGEVPVGAVLVQDGEIIGRGFNCPISGNDPSAHAEMVAIRAAAQAISNYRLVGSTLYVTLEPCSMCAGLIVHSRVARVVYGALEPKAGIVQSQGQFFTQGFLNHRVLFEGGVLAEECGAVLSEFFKARRAKP